MGNSKFEIENLKKAREELRGDRTATAMDVIIKSGNVDATPVSPYVGEPTLRDVLANTPLSNGFREVSRNHGSLLYNVTYPVGESSSWSAYAWWDRDAEEFKADLGRPVECPSTIKSDFKDFLAIRKKHGPKAARTYLLHLLIGVPGNIIKPYVRIGEYRKQRLEEVFADTTNGV